MGIRRFSSYLAGLPDDSAFITRLRAPHEERHRKLDEMKQSMSGAGSSF